MRLTRIYTPGHFKVGATIALTPDGAHHVAKVLRAHVGDEIHVFDGQGKEFAAHIVAVNGKNVTVAVDREVSNSTRSPLSLMVVQGISRGERMDLVVQKATELGVDTIVPVLTTRSVVKLDKKQATVKLEHWQKIAVSACEQCGRAHVTRIDTPTVLTEFLLRKTEGMPLRLILEPSARHSLGESVERKIGDGLHEKRIELLIGPEGGFDEAEVQLALDAGFIPVSFGPRVLRTETAAVAVIAVLQAMLGDLR